jgi:ABC transporter fused permease/ATP-binding protein
MAKRRGKESLKEDEKRALNKGSFKKLLGVFRFVAPYKKTFILGMICLLFSSTTLLVFPFLAGKLIDVASGKSWEVNSSLIINSINTLAIGLVAALFFQSIFSFFRVYLFAQVSERSMADVRKSVFSKMIMLPTTFFDKSRIGELISRITSDVSMLQDTFSTTLAELFRQIATLIIGVGVIFFIAPKLTFFMLATFPVLVLSALIFGKSIRKLSRATQDKLAEANTIVEETLQAINVVKAFTNELFEKKRYSSSLNEVVKIALKTATYRGAFISFVIFALFGGIVAVMWYGATLVQEGSMTVGDLLSFILYTTFIGGSIAGLGDIYGQVQRAIGASERVLEIIDEEGELIGENFSKVKFKGEITFNQVGFEYPTRSEIKVLKNINFKIGAGKKIALVGQSGAGKSTIIQLLSRYYDVTSGKIEIDGRDIKEYDLKSLRLNIGMVPQEVMLFGGTIKENIAYGRPEANEEEIIEAARKANALEFIEKFPEGMQTIVGERGVKLSGGQRQRVAIARAILKDPAILVLDEATSSLDAESEHLVQQALDELMKGRTTIMIAHRLATVRKADKIFVIKDGQIIEEGNHEELSADLTGMYSYLSRLQFQLN